MRDELAPTFRLVDCKLLWELATTVRGIDVDACVGLGDGAGGITSSHKRTLFATVVVVSGAIADGAAPGKLVTTSVRCALVARVLLSSASLTATGTTPTSNESAYTGAAKHATTTQNMAVRVVLTKLCDMACPPASACCSRDIGCILWRVLRKERGKK